MNWSVSISGGAGEWAEVAVAIKPVINHAPTITNGATVTLTGTNENTTSSGTTVSSILTSTNWADVDAGALSGIAITSTTGNGTWQYSTDGVTWTAFGAVSSSNALLLDSASQVRYIPDGINGETTAFGFKAWDQTGDTASTIAAPSYTDPGAGGGTTAYSSQSASASITVTSVNDAPTVTNGATVTLTGTSEDTTSGGTTVSSILTAASWIDVDTGAVKGIAITSQTGNGTWQYSTDGTTWTAFGAVSDTNALLLTSSSQVRYIPDGLNGETATFGFVAWDQTTGTASTNATPRYANPDSGGGSTAYSSQSATGSMTITSVNDAPHGISHTVTTPEDAAYVFKAADFGFSDPNDKPANNFLAVEITTLPGAGTLTDNGLAVTAGQFISVSDINAGLLVFTPATNANGTGYASFTFQVQDDGGTANGGVDTDTTPRTMTVDVIAENDAPVNSIPGARTQRKTRRWCFPRATGTRSP